MMALPACKHVFHADCMASWLRVRHTCPLCVGRVTASRVRQAPLVLDAQIPVCNAGLFVPQHLPAHLCSLSPTAKTHVQTTESLRAEEASILAELAELNRDSDSGAPAAAEGTQADVVTPPQLTPPPRGFGMGTGQLLWGNSRAAGWQGSEDTSGADENGGSGRDHVLAEQDMNPLTSL